MPMLEEKLAVFHQVGDVLNGKYGGRFLIRALLSIPSL